MSQFKINSESELSVWNMQQLLSTTGGCFPRAQASTSVLMGKTITVPRRGESSAIFRFYQLDLLPQFTNN